MDGTEGRKNFWKTIPGVLAGIASSLTAVATIAAVMGGLLHRPHAETAAPPPPIQQAPATEVVKLQDLSQCGEITGRWAWFTGGEVLIGKDGSIGWRRNPADPAPTVTGRWTCTDSTPRTFLLSWQHGITDVVTLSPDRKSLGGSNAAGVRVSATRQA